MQILFVCLGNICRSPLADGLLRKKVTENKLDVLVDSAGTAGYHIGEAPDSRMIATAKARNTDLSFLRARQFKASDFGIFERIYVMDTANLKNVLSIAKTEAERAKVSLVLDSIEPGMEVPDPYYGNQAGFDHVYDLLDEATTHIILKLKDGTL